MNANTKSRSHLGAATSFTSVCVAALAACGGSASDQGTTPVVAAAHRVDLPAAARHDAFVQSASPDDAPALPNLLPALNDSGFATTFSLAGAIDRSGPFFQSLGSNGRSCATCHAPSDGWTITPGSVQARFALSAGTDPIFRINDGSNAPSGFYANTSTVTARSSSLRKPMTRTATAAAASCRCFAARCRPPTSNSSAR